jgi:SAM-dependent methyltransferase
MSQKFNENIECPICGALKGYNLWFVRLRGSRTGKYNPLYFCNNCDSFFQRPNYHEDDNTLKGDLLWLLNFRNRNKKHTERVIRQIIQIHPGAKTLLDIGCGLGTSIQISQTFGIIAQGVEPNPYAVKFAMDNLSIPLKQAYFSAQLFNNKFDIIIIDNVLEHVPLPQILIRDVFEVLNPGGIIFLAVPNRDGGILRIVYSYLFPICPNSLFFDNDVHINHFSRKSILKLIEPYNAILRLDTSSGEFFIQSKSPDPNSISSNN